MDCRKEVALLGHQASCIISPPSVVSTQKRDCGPLLVKCYIRIIRPNLNFHLIQWFFWPLSIFLEITTLWLVKRHYEPDEDNLWLFPSGIWYLLSLICARFTRDLIVTSTSLRLYFMILFFSSSHQNCPLVPLPRGPPDFPFGELQEMVRGVHQLIVSLWEVALSQNCVSKSVCHSINDVWGDRYK